MGFSRNCPWRSGPLERFNSAQVQLHSSFDVKGLWTSPLYFLSLGWIDGHTSGLVHQTLSFCLLQKIGTEEWLSLPISAQWYLIRSYIEYRVRHCENVGEPRLIT